MVGFNKQQSFYQLLFYSSLFTVPTFITLLVSGESNAIKVKTVASSQDESLTPFFWMMCCARFYLKGSL